MSPLFMCVQRLPLFCVTLFNICSRLKGLIGSPKIFSMTSFSLSLRSICAVGVLLLALRSSVDDSELVCELERALKLLLEG